MASEREISKKGDDDYVDFKKFCAVPKLDEFKWDLPENLAKYAQMIISTNLSLKMIHTKASDLVKLLQKLLDAMGPLSEVWNTVK